MIRQPIVTAHGQLHQATTSTRNTPSQPRDQVVKVTNTNATAKPTVYRNHTAIAQSKSQMTQKFDKLINSARLLLNDSSNKVATVKNKTQILNATEKIVETLEQSVEQLQQTLAMMDGIKCNEEERLERATVMYSDAERLVTECEGIMKELTEVQERAKECRQSFALETGELQNKFQKFEQYVYKMRDEKDKKEVEVLSEYKKRDNLNIEIANLLQQIDIQKKLLEEKKEEGVKLDNQYLVLVNIRQECITNLQTHVKRTEEVKKRCTELYEEIQSVNERISREDEDLRKHLCSIEKINVSKLQLDQIQELASSLETIAQLPSKVSELFHRIDVVYQISTDQFSQFVSGLDKKICLLLEANDSVNMTENQLEKERLKLSEAKQQYDNLKEELSSLQNKHYQLIARSRELEKSNTFVREERDRVLKEVELHQELLLAEGEKLQSVKTEAFDLEKDMKKRKRDFRIQKDKLESEYTQLEKDKQEIDHRIIEVNSKKIEQTEKMKLLETQLSSLIEENEGLDAQLRENKEKEQAHVNEKREELDRWLQILHTEKDRTRELTEEVTHLEKQMEDLKNNKEHIQKRESVEQEISEYERSLQIELKKEIDKMKQQYMLDSQKEEEELRKKYVARVDVLDQKKSDALKIFKDEEKRLLELHNQKIKELTGNEMPFSNQGIMLPPSPVTPSHIPKVVPKNSTPAKEHEYSIDFNTQPKDDEDDLFASPIRTPGKKESQRSKTPQTKQNRDDTIVNSSQKKRFARRQLSITKVTATEETESWFNE